MRRLVSLSRHYLPGFVSAQLAGDARARRSGGAHSAAFAPPHGLARNAVSTTPALSCAYANQITDAAPCVHASLVVMLRSELAALSAGAPVCLRRYLSVACGKHRQIRALHSA